MKLIDIVAMIKPILENPKIKKTAYNVKAQYGILRDYGINADGFVMDIMLASYIKNPSRNHELQVQSIEHISHAICEYAPYEKNKKNKGC